MRPRNLTVGINGRALLLSDWEGKDVNPLKSVKYKQWILLGEIKNSFS
jgi:hypothetical protein